MTTLIEAIIARAEKQRLRTEGIIVRACPFCGCTARLHVTLGLWHADCVDVMECGTIGPTADTPEDAAAKWNEAIR